MKILGTGRLDDFQKVLIPDDVMRSIGAKPGDGIIFSKVTGGSNSGPTVQMFKAEGTCLSAGGGGKNPWEIDRRHEKNSHSTRVLVGMGIIFSFIMFLLVANLFRDGDKIDFDIEFIEITIFWTVSIIVMIGAFVCTVPPKYASGRLVTVRGPMGKDRLIGLSKLLSDGYITSGTVYCYQMFDSNPDTVTVTMTRADGTKEPVQIKCIRDTPGLMIFKIKVKGGDISGGSLNVRMIFKYADKAIVADARYRLTKDKENSMSVRLEDEEITAKICFDNKFQKAEFDESLFDPTDEEAP